MTIDDAILEARGPHKFCTLQEAAKVLADEVERLWAKLPKTADGVPITPEQHVWHEGVEYRVWCVWGHLILLGERLPENVTVQMTVPAKDCYSTREAAEAAQAAEES